MVKAINQQFLLNADGSYPEGTNVALLQELGYRFVIPTQAPHVPGEISIEQEPELRDGAWYQCWISRIPGPEDQLATAPAVSNISDFLSTLTTEQQAALQQALGL